MKITGTFCSSVEIEPLDVLTKLRDKELQSGYDVVEKDGKYYIGYGYKNRDDNEVSPDIEISKKKYDYIKAIQIVGDYLAEQIK